jgi:hypothetical protein
MMLNRFSFKSTLTILVTVAVSFALNGRADEPAEKSLRPLLIEIQKQRIDRSEGRLNEEARDLLTLALMVQGLDKLGHAEYRRSTLKNVHALENEAEENPKLVGESIGRTVMSWTLLTYNQKLVRAAKTLRRVYGVANNWQPEPQSALFQPIQELRESQLLSKVYFVLAKMVLARGENAERGDQINQIAIERMAYLMRSSTAPPTYGSLHKTDDLWHDYLAEVSRLNSAFREVDDVENTRFQELVSLMDQVVIEGFVSRVENRVLTKKFEALMNLLQSLSPEEWKLVYDNISLHADSPAEPNGAQTLVNYWIKRQRAHRSDVFQEQTEQVESYYKNVWKFVGDLAISLKEPRRTSARDWLLAPLEFYFKPSLIKEKVAWNRGFEYNPSQIRELQSVVIDNRIDRCRQFLEELQSSRSR